jgi:hypothetical protein
MPHTDKTYSISPRLTEEQVRERLTICQTDEILDELYTYGQTLIEEALERIRSIESKAVSFAAYGAAIVTILVSNSKSWSKLGNQWSPWIAFYASLCGLACTYLCVCTLSLRQYKVTSQDEWLDPECLGKSVHFLKRFRILTMWGLLDSYTVAQGQKANKLQRAEAWLAGSVGYLVFLLFQLAFLHASSDGHWLSFWQGAVHYELWSSLWERFAGSVGVLGDFGCVLAFGLPLLLIIYRAGRR